MSRFMTRGRSVTASRWAGVFVLGLAGLLLPFTSSAVDVRTAFTYQGELRQAGAQANGDHDFLFKLFDAETGGAQIGATEQINGVSLSEGRFTVEIDFGSDAFGDGARWLDISVRPSGGALYQILTPRQEVSATPYALALPNVHTNPSSGFVGIGRNTPITPYEVFGVSATTTVEGYGGMYIDVSSPAAKSFYGFAQGGSARAWMEYDSQFNRWSVYNGGTRLIIPNHGGLEIPDDNFVFDGLRVGGSQDDGIQVGGLNGNALFPSYGVYIPFPGVESHAIHAQTANPDGVWGLYTPDMVYAGAYVSSTHLLVAVATGTVPLEPGDVVAPVGVAALAPGGTHHLVAVQPAGPDTEGIAGVVTRRLEYGPTPGKENDSSFRYGEGPAMDGDFVQLSVLGVTEVKVEPGTVIEPGMRLTASAAHGRARPLQERKIEGMTVREGAPVIGLALEESRGTGTVPVFVHLR